nr:aminopeptidase P family protein [Desulfuromonadales bacterium]
MTGLHFDRSEHEARIAKARALLKERSLSALLIFAQESHYYLTGYDSTGYLFFQVALLTA